MKYRYPLAILAVGLLLLGAACGKKAAVNTNVANDLNTSDNTNSVEDNSNAAVTNTNSDDRYTNVSDDNTNASDNEDTTNSNTNTSDDKTNTNSSTDDTPTASGTLTVSKPEKNDEVESPAEIKGKSSADQVYIRFTNSSGQEMFTVAVTVRQGEFHLEPDFQFTNTTSGFVEVFEKDVNGKEVNLVKIPVTFKVEAAETNTNMNSNTNSD